MRVLYSYPKWHVVSFTLIARKHIEYLKRIGKIEVYELDELATPSYVPSTKYTLVMHPGFYIMHRVLQSRRDAYGRFREDYYQWWRNNYDQLIGIDVCDSDKYTDIAISLANRFDKFIVPSTFCVEVAEKCGVKAKVYRLPHGVDPEWYKTPNIWDIAPVKAINPSLLQLYLYKIRKNKKLLLFWLWHCYDEKTRVLTKDGFKHWWELKYDDEIATVNLETGELEYQKPEEIIVADYEGYMIHFKGQHYDLLVTPNHRMIVRQSRHNARKKGIKEIVNDVIDHKRPWKIIYAEELARNWGERRWEFLRAIKWKGKKLEYVELPDLELNPRYPKWVLGKVPNKPRGLKKIPIKPLLRFLGWFIAEGWARYNKHNQEFVVGISNKKREYLDEIAQTVREMGFHPIVDYGSNDRTGKVIVASKQLYMFIKSLGLPVHPDIKGEKAKYKFVPQFIKELDPELIKEFVDALWRGDGTFSRSKDGKLVYLKYVTKSKRLAEDVAELMLKLGYAVAIHYEKKRDIYNVVVSERYRFPEICKQPKIVHYKGKIWCIRVPNGTLVVERNGKVVVSGNSADRKGWPEVYEVYTRLAKERKDVALVLKTVNPGSREFQMIMQYGAIEIYGWLSDYEKMALYDLADITLNFSRGGGFELNCLESLARGVPCIASDFGSWTDYVPEYLQVKRGRKVLPLPGNALHGGYGYTVDVEDALNKINDILDNLDEYRAKTEEWRKKKLAIQYRWDVIAHKLTKILEE